MAVELCCDETRLGEVGRGLAVELRLDNARFGAVRRGGARHGGNGV